MAAERAGLHQLLTELKCELDRISEDNPDEQAKLRGLVDTIEARINARLEEDPQQELFEEITEEVVEFENDHPEFAATVRNLVNMLSNLGI